MRPKKRELHELPHTDMVKSGTIRLTPLIFFLPPQVGGLAADERAGVHYADHDDPGLRRPAHLCQGCVPKALGFLKVLFDPCRMYQQSTLFLLLC